MESIITMHGHDSIGWRQLVHENIRYNMTTAQFMPMQNNPSSQIWNAFAGLTTGFLASAVSASFAQSAQNAQTAQRTSMIFAEYTAMESAINDAEAELKTMQDQSDAYAKDLTYLENQTTQDDSLNAQIAAHQANYDATNVTQQFNTLNNTLNTLNNFKTGKVKEYNDALATKQKELATAQGKPTTGSASHANTSFSLTGTANSGAEASVQANKESQYYRRVKNSDGEYIQQLDQAGFDADLQLAQQLDANAKDIETKKDALKKHENTKNSITCPYGNGQTANIDNIDAAISDVSRELETLKQQQVNGNKGTANTTFGEYQSKLDDFNKQKAHNDEVKTLGKDQIKQKKNALDEQIKVKEAEIKNAKQELKKYEAFVKDAQASADRIVADEQNLANAKANVKNARKTGADGEKRTFLQRLFGMNKSDALKTYRQERREARQQLRADTAHQTSVYGYQVNDAYLQALNEMNIT